MSGAGQSLLEIFSGAVWDLLARCRTQAQGALASLQPQPGFAGTVLETRLLEPLNPDAVVGGDAAVSTLLSAIKALLPTVNGGAVSLHGYDPGGGQQRGLALLFAGPAPVTAVVTALTGDGPSGIALEIAAAGKAPFGPVALPLAATWSLTLAGDFSGGGRLQFARGAAPAIVGGAAPSNATFGLVRAAAATPLTIGPAAGPHLTLAGVSATLTANLNAQSAPALSAAFALPGAELSLSFDALAAVLGNSATLPIDLNFGIDPASGITFAGGGVEATISTQLSLPGVDIRALELSITNAGSNLLLGFGLALTAGLPFLPIRLTIDGLGAAFPVATGAGALGVDPGGVQLLMPKGLGIDLTLPVLSGGGFLTSTGPGGYAAMLELDMDVMMIEAFGLLQLPVNGQSLSFAAIISATFPYPGINIGFGFALTAVGGIVAVNRRLDSDALERTFTDGSAGQLLFPVDPAANGPAIVASLQHVFPPADGHIVVGPMLQIGWGGRILAITLAVIIDLPDPVQLVVIGRMRLALPDPLAPLVLLQATVVGAFKLSPNPSMSVLASLEGSNIGGMPLHGDFYFLIRTGDDAAFVISVGGFHPRYVPPAGIPALHRVQLDITPPGFPGLRSELYFALTSNSVQIGAHLELCYEVAGCGLDGWFNFDALFIWDPVFLFSIHVSAGIAVQVLGETLMGISLDLVVEGPTPWHVHGSGSVDLFLFSASLDFDVRWGDAPASIPPPEDIASIVGAAFAAPAAWIGAPPVNDTSMVTLSPDASALAAGGHRIHPLGSVTARQRAIPLGIAISRYQNVPIPVQTWSIAGARLGGVGIIGAPTMDTFPPGAFLTLSEDEKLTRRAFESLPSGVSFTSNAVVASDLRAVSSDFETILVPDISLGLIAFELNLFASEALLANVDLHGDLALWSLPAPAPVVVLPDVPVAAASTATLQAQILSAAPAGLSYTATLGAAQTQFGAVGPAASVQIVEAWELVV